MISPRISSLAFRAGLKKDAVPHGAIALAVLYFFSSASMFLWAYMPSYMTALGWTGAHIGAFFMIKMISQALATPIVARLAGRDEGAGRRILRMQHWVAIAAIAALSVANSWMVGIAVAILLGATVRASAPLMDTMTLDAVGMGRFGRIRSSGTIGFGVVALLFAGLGAGIDYNHLATAAPWAMLALTALCLPAITRLPSSPSARTPTGSGSDPKSKGRNSYRDLLLSPIVILVFPIAALFVATHAPYTIFLVGLAEERSFGAWLPGIAVFVGVLGEFLAFLWFHRLSRNASPEWLLGIVVVVTGFRWVLTGITTSPVLFVGLQILHGLTFAVFFMALLSIVRRQWGPDRGADSQAMLYLFVFTIGGGIGTLAAGILVDISSAATLFKYAGLVCFILLPGLIFALHSLKVPETGVAYRPLPCPTVPYTPAMEHGYNSRLQEAAVLGGAKARG